MKVSLPLIGFAFILLSALLFVAGSPAINVVSHRVADFFGIAAGMAGVLFWVIYGITRQPNEAGETE